jgi:hypothetical protein
MFKKHEQVQNWHNAEKREVPATMNRIYIWAQSLDHRDDQIHGAANGNEIGQRQMIPVESESKEPD